MFYYTEVCRIIVLYNLMHVRYSGKKVLACFYLAYLVTFLVISIVLIQD